MACVPFICVSFTIGNRRAQVRQAVTLGGFSLCYIEHIGGESSCKFPDLYDFGSVLSSPKPNCLLVKKIPIIPITKINAREKTILNEEKYPFCKNQFKGGTPKQYTARGEVHSEKYSQ